MPRSIVIKKAALKLHEELRSLRPQVEDATPDELRAKIYARQGNLLNAFRQMDNSGDSRISYEEFLVFIPKVHADTLESGRPESSKASNRIAAFFIQYHCT